MRCVAYNQLIETLFLGGNMKRFILGMVAGLLIGASGAAVAAEVVGWSGYLIGWDVMVGSKTICSDPFVWPGIRTIECD